MAIQPLLILLLSPIILALPVYILGRSNPSIAKWSTTGIVLLTSVYSFYLWFFNFIGRNIYSGVSGDKVDGFVMHYKTDWIAEAGISFSVGVDGLSMPLLVLTQVVFLVSIVSSYFIKDQEATYYALLLVLLSGIVGTF
ncbi:MAG: hypothetical protein IH840_03005, partial [Candidatus Heimdallarchaeota archaeon]|nr:hypothetical protein [Candidatus Heimdallarchaeota archaeon]